MDPIPFTLPVHQANRDETRWCYELAQTVFDRLVSAGLASDVGQRTGNVSLTVQSLMLVAAKLTAQAPLPDRGRFVEIMQDLYAKAVKREGEPY